MKLLILKLKEYMCRISGKDPMEYRLERYRIAGAKIGGGVEPFPLFVPVNRI